MTEIIFANRLKELRTMEGLTQTELAKANGMSQSIIALWEQGARLPHADAIMKMAEFFGVTTDYLLGVSDEM